MSPDLLAALPASMVEAAARALAAINIADQVHIDSRWANPELEDWRNVYRDRARAVLAAALAECEVREEWSCEIDLGQGWQRSPYITTDREPEDAYVGDIDKYMHAIKKPKRKSRRVVFTAPWSPADTPREETTP